MGSTDTRKGWLDQLRDDPSKYVVVEIPEARYTVHAVPDVIRVLHPEYHERKELQLGLHNRTLQTGGTQQLKCDIAGSLHTHLLKVGSSWPSFASAIVGDVAVARGHYQKGADVPDEVVPYMLAMDALFLVVFFQYLNGTIFFDEFDHLSSRLEETAHTLVRSDILLVENQVPMYMLRNVVEQFYVLKPPLEEVDVLKKKKQRTWKDELHDILVVAVEILYPLWRPDNFGHGLDNKYEVEPYELKHSLLHCKHILECVYVVVCGHTLPLVAPPEPKSDKTLSNLDSIPPVTRLLGMGIRVTGTALTLDQIRLKGSGYVRSASLRVPKVSVYDYTESLFHNLAVYEQLVDNGRRGDVRSFLQCMECLSSDAADVRLLVDRGVVENKVGSNVLGMWERVMRGVNSPDDSSSWLRLYQEIHLHRRSRVKRWRREMWVLFFAKPWTFVGLVGASAILFLTAVQTWFTVVNSSQRGWRWPDGP